MKNNKCKHRFHLLRDYYSDGMALFPREHMVIFVCEECGILKRIKTWEKEE